VALDHAAHDAMEAQSRLVHADLPAALGGWGRGVEPPGELRWAGQRAIGIGYQHVSRTRIPGHAGALRGRA
jgi:hypothetical protein